MQVPRDGLQQKLERLSQSQQSIESVSSFCIFYHKDAKGVVQVWEQEFYKAPADRKLALLYLANHILQEGRKKGMSFQEEYFKTLPKAVSHVVKYGDDKAKKAVTRLVTVWEERRVFGSRHIKSFRDVLGLPADTKPAAMASIPAAAVGNGSSAVAKLGPVGDALSNVLQQSHAATLKGQEFKNSWSQNLLTTAGLGEVTAAQGKLKEYSAALESEVLARKAAATALNAELSRQTAELSRAESQLQTVAGQQQQLAGRLTLLTSQLTSAMGSLSQLFQQGNGFAGVAAASGAAAAAAAGFDGGGSPQAPDLELEDDDPAELPSHATDTSQQQQHLQLQHPGQPQQQQQQPQLITHDLQALLANPEMLSALAGAAAAAPPASASFAAAGQSVTLQIGGAADGMQLQLPTEPPPSLAAGPGGPGSAGGFVFPGAGYTAAAGVDGAAARLLLGAGLGQAATGYDSSGLGLDQQQSGFADEADDPYDPEHPD